jgi:allophanate hydrolase subunit 2
VSGRSDHIGLRLSGPAIAQAVAGEILSRGVPVGAIETPPGGGIIVLLRGRMVTAGYPVMGVVTTEALDRLGQAGPGTTVFVDPCSRREAHERLRAREADLNRLAGRVGAAFRAAGLGGLLETGHRASA